MHDMTMYLDPKKLELASQKLGKTIPQIAAESSISRRTLYKMFNDPFNANPTLSTLSSLAKSLNCSPWDLVTE